MTLAKVIRLPASPYALSQRRGMKVVAEVMKGREDRRRARRETREFPLRSVDLARARNEMDCCAACGEPLNAREFVAWATVDMTVSHVRCN